MKKRISSIPLIFCLACLICSCKSMTPDAAKRAYCNTLKSDIVFNGATGVTREANIQNSQAPLQERNYNAADCEVHNSI